MLTQVIQFGMHNTDETFVVPNEEGNYELIASNRWTRQIKFMEMFSFQATKEMKAPSFFIEALVQEYVNEIVAIEEAELFDYDEMVGIY
jgi:hypothetical protein